MQIWVVPSLNPAKVFSDPRPSFWFSVTTDPPFVLVRIKWSPQAIHNDRSLISTDKLEIAAPSAAERFRIVWSISSVYSIENWIHFQVPRLALRKLLPIVNAFFPFCQTILLTKNFAHVVNLKQQVEWKLNGSQHHISLTKTSRLSRFGWCCSTEWPKQGTIPLCYSYLTVTSSLYLFVQKRYPLINFHSTTTLLAMNFWREISKKERIAPVILILFWFRFFFFSIKTE